MVHSEYPPAGDSTFQIAEELLQNFAIAGNPYNNIVLSTNHPDFVDTFIRQALLESAIGSAALARVPEVIRQGWERLKAMHPAPILYATERCIQRDLPLALCQTGRIIKSGVGPENKRIMHLWYPNYLSPKPVLATLKKVVQGAIDNETMY